MAKQVWHFILYGSVFIAACAVALAMETSLILGIPFNSLGFYSFIFGATIVQYNLHYISKTTAVKGSTRLSWSQKNRRTHYLLLVAGTALILYSLTTFHLRHFYILLCLGAIATLYSFPVIPFLPKKRIKEYGLLKILTLSLLWTLVTVWFPSNHKNYDPVLYWFVFSKRFIFMFVLCLLFDMRDVEVDSRQNINTIPVKWGLGFSYKVSYFLLLVFAGLSVASFFYFRQIAVLVPMLLSAAVTFFMIERTKTDHSDNMFLAGIDGMMILQAVLIYLFTINF